MSFEWQAGRQMYSTTATSGTVYRYRYNDDGIRYMKWGNGVTTSYYLDGSTILAETKSNGTKIVYMHDENGNYVGFILNGTKYYYAFNAQGDVVGIYNIDGEVVARYRYDAWGKVISVTDGSLSTITDATHPANVNPIRYRGYYYDVETGLYYLNSRYYDPTVGRFVNADSILPVLSEYMQDYNLYAYCEDDWFGDSTKQIVDMRSDTTKYCDISDYNAYQRREKLIGIVISALGIVLISAIITAGTFVFIKQSPQKKKRKK